MLGGDSASPPLVHAHPRLWGHLTFAMLEPGAFLGLDKRRICLTLQIGNSGHSGSSLAKGTEPKGQRALWDWAEGPGRISGQPSPFTGAFPARRRPTLIK